MKLYNFDFSKKIFYHPEKIVEYKQGKRPFPTSLEIDLTNICNHRCDFCFHAEHRAKDKSSLDTDLIKKRIKETCELGTKGISFTGGGEPMIHKDFIGIMEYTHSLGLHIGLITNGSLINEDNASKMIKCLTWIRISMGGGDKESYHKVQGVNQFERVIKNIKILSDTKTKEKSSLNIGIRVLVTKENLQSLANLTNIIKDFNINYLQVAPDQFTNDCGKFWNDQKTKEVFSQVEKIISKKGIMLLTAGYMMFQDNLDHPRTCYAHFFHSAIIAEGYLLFCKNARDKEKYYVGNITKKTLKEIWNSEHVKKLESYIKPYNCGLFCKNLALNIAMEDSLHPALDVSFNFVG